MALSGHVVRVIDEFKISSKKPENFLRSQPESAEKFLSLTKDLYDLSRKTQEHVNGAGITFSGLKDLITEHFDDEQVWQQLELRNNPFLSDAVKVISRISAKNYLRFGIEINEPVEDNENELNLSDEENEYEEDFGESSESPKDSILFKKDKNEKEKKNKKKQPTAVCDDQFFKLSEMEEFLKQVDLEEERKQQKGDDSSSDGESIDYFEDIPSDESDESDNNEDLDEEEDQNAIKSGKNAVYDDFFDPPENEVEGNSSEGEADVKEMEPDNREYDTRDVDENDLDELSQEKLSQGAVTLASDSESEAEEKELKKSAFEKQQENLKKKIEKLEERNLDDKPWQLKGEVTARGRPVNSLLEEHLQFDHMTRQAPVITEDTTKKLEDIILQRIKDKAWDDVERKIKPVEEPFEYRRRITLNQDKSKISLAEVYEQEYLKQQTEKKDDVVPEHKDIEAMMSDLFAKLDALSNFHFTPKPVAPEVKVVNNMPAVTVEEVTPVGMSDATLLAPEEVKEKQKRELKGSTEKSSTDRKRERRLKKLLQRKKKLAKEAKLKLKAQTNPALAEKLSKQEAVKKLKKAKNAKILKNNEKWGKNAVSSSKNFFARLQDEVSNVVSVSHKKNKEKKIKEQKKSIALKL